MYYCWLVCWVMIAGLFIHLLRLGLVVDFAAGLVYLFCVWMCLVLLGWVRFVLSLGLMWFLLVLDYLWFVCVACCVLVCFSCRWYCCLFDYLLVGVVYLFYWFDFCGFLHLLLYDLFVWFFGFVGFRFVALLLGLVVCYATLFVCLGVWLVVLMTCLFQVTRVVLVCLVCLRLAVFGLWFLAVLVVGFGWLGLFGCLLNYVVSVIVLVCGWLWFRLNCLIVAFLYIGGLERCITNLIWFALIWVCCFIVSLLAICLVCIVIVVFWFGLCLCWASAACFDLIGVWLVWLWFCM